MAEASTMAGTGSSVSGVTRYSNSPPSLERMLMALPTMVRLYSPVCFEPPRSSAGGLKQPVGTDLLKHRDFSIWRLEFAIRREQQNRAHQSPAKPGTRLMCHQR